MDKKTKRNTKKRYALAYLITVGEFVKFGGRWYEVIVSHQGTVSSQEWTLILRPQHAMRYVEDVVVTVPIIAEFDIRMPYKN